MINLDLLKKHIKPLTPVSTSLSPKGRLKEPVKCVLFDIYGTLLISGSGDTGDTKISLKENKALKELLKNYNIEILPDDLIEKYISQIIKTHENLKKKGIYYPEVDIIKIWSHIFPEMAKEKIKVFAMEFEMITNPVWPMPYLKELLLFCRKKNIKTGIISNAQFYTPLLFQLFLGKNLYDLGFDPELTIFSYKQGCAKPSLSLFIKADKILQDKNINTKSVLYVGNDMLKDIMPAYKTGFQTGLFAGDKRSLRLRQNETGSENIHPNIVLTSLNQLINHLKNPG